MDYDSLLKYVEDNEFDWLGVDFEHIEEYLDFVSYMQDEVEFRRVVFKIMMNTWILSEHLLTKKI